MRKAVLMSAIVGLMLVLSGGGAVQAGSFSIGPVFGYWSPSYGEINKVLAETGIYLDPELELKGGFTLGVGAEYRITRNWSSRLELFTFDSATSDSLSEDVADRYVDYIDGNYECEVSVMPILGSGLYYFRKGRALSGYLGGGIGFYPTKAEISVDEEVVTYGTTSHSLSWSDSGSHFASGFHFLGGVAYELTPNLTLCGEARYVFGAEAEVIRVQVDWSGFLIFLEGQYKF